jgi:hypothetical protein
MADDFRLLGYFLCHEVAVIAFVHQKRGGLGKRHGPLHGFSLDVVKGHGIP